MLYTAMENYEKKDIVKSFPALDKDVVKCTQYGRLHGFIHFSKKLINDNRTVTLSGIGSAINKAISTAEVLKTSMPLHQTNTIYFAEITEIWIPKEKQDLQNIEVKRKLPAISITLTLDEPTEKLLGYQPPNPAPEKHLSKKPKFKKYQPRPKDKDKYPFVRNQTELEEKVKSRAKKRSKNVDSKKLQNNISEDKSVPNDKEVESVPNDKEVESVPNDKEVESVPIDKEVESELNDKEVESMDNKVNTGCL